MAEDEVDTRRLILNTAETLFMQHGYGAVSMAKVVEAVSRVRPLTKPAVYYHFADKEALYVAVVLHVLERTRVGLEAARTLPGRLSVRVAAMSNELSRVSANSLAQMRTDMQEHLSPVSQKQLYEGFQHSIQAPLIQLLVDAQAVGEVRADFAPELLASALLGLISGIRGRGARTAESALDQTVAELFLKGVQQAVPA